NRGTLHAPSASAAHAGSAATIGSAAYQYISGRFWSSLSSSCAGVARASRPRCCASRAAPGERLSTWQCPTTFGVFRETRNTAGGTPALPRGTPSSLPSLLLRHPPRDERGDLRNLARAERLGGPGGLGGDDWLGGIP